MPTLGGLARRAAEVSANTARRLRREGLEARIRAAAWRVGATVSFEAPPDLVIGRDIQVTVEPGTHTVLRWGSRCRLDDRVLLMLKGGKLLAGDGVEIRRDVVLNITGTLTIEGDTPISWGSVIHCSNDIVLERMVGVAEQVTIADSSHYFTTPDEHFWHNVRTGSVRVGTNTWLCPKSVVTRGADIGSHCIVASGSVVTGKVPDGSLASGVPAVVRPLPLPWAT